jgi:hypothetical protein
VLAVKSGRADLHRGPRGAPGRSSQALPALLVAIVAVVLAGVLGLGRAWSADDVAPPQPETTGIGGHPATPEPKSATPEPKG